jgi:hypothetical protein
MKLLNSLYLLSEANSKKGDLSVLGGDVIKELKKNIKDGANDPEQDWSNALELVNQAFKVAGVERPTPAERGGWQQYEELLQLAVEELADARKDVDSSWRMSSTVFREAMEKRIKVRVIEVGDQFGKGHTVEARNMEEIIEMVRKQAGQKAFDMDVEDHGSGSCTCRFSYHGIKRPYHIKLQRL